jgi:ribosomal protein S18 acetylase RimI-like enzyme
MGVARRAVAVTAQEDESAGPVSDYAIETSALADVVLTAQAPRLASWASASRLSIGDPVFGTPGEPLRLSRLDGDGVPRCVESRPACRLFVTAEVEQCPEERGWIEVLRNAEHAARSRCRASSGKRRTSACAPAFASSATEALHSGAMPAITIRRAARGDLPDIARLAHQLVLLHHNTDPGRFFMPDRVEEGYTWWFGRELENPKAVILAALEDGAVVGYAYGTLDDRDFNQLLDRHGSIHDVLVSSAKRRGRVGRRLVDALISELTGLGAPRVVLHTMVSNTAAQALFRSAGFRDTMLEMTRGPAPE